jgi:hypothetical protein
MRQLLGLALAIVLTHALLATSPLCAQVVVQQPAQGQQAQRQNNEILVRTYNVSDLLRLTSDYPRDSHILPPSEIGSGPPIGSGGGAGAGGQSLFGGSGGVKVGVRTGPPIELDPLSDLIVQTIDPESWANNGGNVGQIRTLSSMLIIVQTRANHDTIQSLLDELRQTAGPAQIATVNAKWLVVAAGEVPRPMAEVSEEWLKRQKVYCESQLTCFSGQTVHVSSGRSRRIIAESTPIVGTLSSMDDPDVQSVLSGVTLQVAPLLIPGTDFAVVDVQTAASEWSPGEQGTTRHGTIDRAAMLCQEMKTTARVPLRKKVIIGGMTLDPSDAEQGGRQLYLVVEIDAPK